MQKKALIHLIGIPAIIIVSVVLTGLIFTKTNSNLRERAKQLEGQLIQVRIDLESALRTGSDLESKLQRSAETIAGLERTAASLRESNIALRDRIVQLEKSVQGFIDGLGDIEDSVGEFADIIRQSIGILQAISDRSK